MSLSLEGTAQTSPNQSITKAVTSSVKNFTQATVDHTSNNDNSDIRGRLRGLFSLEQMLARKADSKSSESSRTIATSSSMEDEENNADCVESNETKGLLSTEKQSITYSATFSTATKTTPHDSQEIPLMKPPSDDTPSRIRRKKMWDFMRERVESFVVHEHSSESSEDSQSDLEKGEATQDLRTTVDTAMKTVDFKFWECSLAICLYLLVGVVAYSFVFEKWSIVDSLYFSVVTFTTVGYGDIYPISVGGKVFNAFFALGGIAFLGVALGVIGNYLIEAHAAALESTHKTRQERAASFLDWTEKSTENGTRCSENSSSTGDSGESCSSQDESEEISFRFMDTSHPWVAILAALLIAMIGSTIICWIEGWSWGAALYYVIITASTVGYGDYAPSTPEGRWCCVIFIPLSVGVVGVVLGQVASAMTKDRVEAALDKITACRITVEDLDSIDADKSGTVCRKEFVDFMLVKMNLVDQRCLNKIHEHFEFFDTDNNGYIQKSDLIKRAKQKHKDVRYKLELAAYKEKLRANRR